MSDWFWWFIWYSFAGYLLEKTFAWATRSPQQRRKCFLLLPLCPVYGLALLAVLALPAAWQQLPWILLTGGLVTTAVEYGVHWAYETLLGVHFWDYSGVRGNVGGRVCLSFSLAWGVLTAVAVTWVQPVVAALAAGIPPAVTLAAMILLTADGLCTARFLQATHDTQALRPSAIREI